ncbi:MAG: HNH endonuclease [Gracilimonas sp.]|nr:HNH endonuclease [Gracilimonas sp.]
MGMVIIVGTIIFLIWASVGNAQETKKVTKDVFKLKKTLPEKNEIWKAFISTISQITEASCKCHLPTYRIFEVYEDGAIQYRCLTCSKKGRHSGVKINSALKSNGSKITNVAQVFEIISSTQWKMDNINQGPYGSISNNLTEWEIPNTRGPWYRGITFKPIKETEEELGKRRRRISTKTKQIVWDRDGGQCVNCGIEYDLEYDHIIPFSKGGSNGPNNIQLLCRKCNSKKRAKIL